MSFQGSPQLATVTLLIETVVAAPWAVLGTIRPESFSSVLVPFLVVCMVLAIPVILAVTEAWEQGALRRAR